jgi:hypothetical protein
MTAVELTRALERGDVGNEQFHHVSHLNVAWVYLHECSSVEQATAMMSATLRRFAAAAGKPEKYHETITGFWIRTLAVLRDSAEHSSLDRVLEANPWLLEKDSLLEYYSQETLFSNRARTSWVDPDLKCIPAHATAVYSSGSARDTSHRRLS